MQPRKKTAAKDFLISGDVYQGQGKLAEAIADYTQAILLDQKYKVAYYNRGNAYYRQGKFNEAIADYTQAILLDQKYKVAYYNRGNAYYHQGKFNEAIADYTQAIVLDPKYAFTYNNRGNAYYHQGKFNEAIADYTQAIALDPKYVFPYNNRGNVYQGKRKLAEAIADYTQAITLDPEYSVGYKNLKNLLLDITPNDDLSKIKKTDLLTAIKRNSNADQIQLLKQSLDKNTVLGKRFWKQEGFALCKLKSDPLKEIYDQLKILDPNFIIQDTKAILLTVTTAGMFQGNRMVLRKQNEELDEPESAIGMHNILPQ